MEIYIFRHGRTIWNASGLLQGSIDIELNEKGRELAGRTGEKIKEIHFDRIYSSPLIRAYETACLLRGYRNIPVIRDKRLMELNFGVNEGKNMKALLADKETPFQYFFDRPELYVAPEGGEEFETISQRAAEFMREVIEPQAGESQRLMIVGHGALNKALMRHVRKSEVKDYWAGGLQKNCSAIILSFDGEKYRILDEGKVFVEKPV